jgi:hypothetical protein
MQRKVREEPGCCPRDRKKCEGLTCRTLLLPVAVLPREGRRKEELGHSQEARGAGQGSATSEL